MTWFNSVKLTHKISNNFLHFGKNKYSNKMRSVLRYTVNILHHDRIRVIQRKGFIFILIILYNCQRNHK